jgi:hypothetical protein
MEAEEWILISKDRPAHEQEVIVHCKKGHVFAARYYEYAQSKGQWWAANYGWIGDEVLNLTDVTHWMPLPTAPTEY